MIKHLTCIIVAAAAIATAKDPSSLRQDLALIPLGAVAEVKTLDKRTLRGRLGAIDNHGFELEYVKAGQIVTEVIPLTAVRSVRHFDLQQRYAAKRDAISLLVGIVMVIVGVLAVAHLGA